MRGTGGTLAFANPGVSGAGPTTATRRASTRSTATARAAPARTSRCSRPTDYTPAEPVALREPRLLVRRRARRSSRPAGSVAGSTSTARPSNPLQAISLDSSLSKQIRTSKAPVCAIEDLNGTSFADREHELQREQPRREPRRRPGRVGQRRRSQRARSIFGETVDVSNRLRRPERRRGRHRLPAELRPLAQAPARRDAAERRARDADHHDRLGLVRHPRRAGRHAGSRSSRCCRSALAAFKADLAARGSRAEGRDDGVLRVRPARRLQRLGRHRPWRRRPRARQRLERARRARRRASGRHQPRRRRRPRSRSPTSAPSTRR